MADLILDSLPEEERQAQLARVHAVLGGVSCEPYLKEPQ
jgi:hypothetical protein